MKRNMYGAMNTNYKSLILAISLFFALSASISATPGDLDLTFSGYRDDGKSVLALAPAAPPIPSASNEDGPIKRRVSGNFAQKSIRMTIGPNRQPRFDAKRESSTKASANVIDRLNESLLPGGGVTGGAPFAMTVSGSDVYVGGAFNTAGDISVNYIARWDGTNWSPLGSGMNGFVTALAVSGNGDLYAGGSFTRAGGVSANHIAKWNGSSWSPVGSGTNGAVWALAVSGSDVYAGGEFTTAGGVSANRIAKWDGSSWLPLGSGMNDRVNALAVSGTDVYAGGRFTTAGGAPANKIAKWDGANWAALSSGISSATLSQVNAIAVSGSTVYAGGFFTTAGDSSANGIAKWDGSSWSPLGSGVIGAVNALAISGSGSLIVGGDIDYAGGIWANNIAEWNGSNWSSLGWGLSSQGTGSWVLAVAISGNGIVYAGGKFTTAGGYPADNIAMWNGTGWSRLAPCTGAIAITVTNTNDSGPGSLRQAIVDICSGGLIDFDPSVFATPQTIALTSGELVIENNLTIRGPGRSLLSVSGNNVSRVFFINRGFSATLDHITIRNGYAAVDDDGYGGDGAGITNYGRLTLSNSTVSANSAGYAGGIRNVGTLTVINSTISGNTAVYADGGVGNNGTMTVTTSIISGNKAGGAGAIWNGGWLTVTDSTISDNRAGGGADSYYDFAGGAIYNEGGMLAINNSTISGNTAISGGGIYNTYYENSGTVYVTNSTMSGNNGGGIFSDSSDESLKNTIVAGNTGTTADISGTIETASHNLIGDAASSGGILNGVNGNIVGANPMLGPLQNNGGPTFTHALLSASPAVNAGDNCVLTANGCGDGNPALPTDQRGMPRNGTVDIGAFERQASETSSPNPIDYPDNFVTQHYRDFLGREPDAPGLAHWAAEITMCGDVANRAQGETEPQCIDRKRTNTSGAFYLSNEFQNSANFLIRVNWGSLGKDRAIGRKCIAGQHSALDAVCRPLYSDYMSDLAKLTQGIVINDALDPNAINTNKHNFVNEFVARPDFLAAYPNTMTATEYVDKLAQTTGILLTSQERADLIAKVGTHGRAAVLYDMVDGTITIGGGTLVFNTRYGRAFYDQEFNPAFVFVQYLAYLRRNPDQAGFDHWLGKLNLYGNFVDAEMVRAFIVSDEYRKRFGPN